MTLTEQRAALTAAGYSAAEIVVILNTMPDVGNDFIEFDGQNCNDYIEDAGDKCSGWNGIDRRCDCGNRRVCWVIEANTAYAEVD